MNPQEYSALVTKLAKPMGFRDDLIHGALGVTSEAGELADAVKASMIYGKPLDQVNLVEEAGDLIFFVEMTLQKFGLTLEDAKRGNAAKLNARYSEGFSESKALGRNKEIEMAHLAKAVWTDAGKEIPLPQVFN